MNGLDNNLYSVGRGPSALTVSAPDLSAASGQAVVIRGTVTDISAGTQQSQQAADFPNGVPCVSDASMTQFMEAVYEQQPMPTNATGVPVTISVIDSNGNNRQIGTTTSNVYGTYSLTWTPDISGSYTVIANFAGTQSYYPSSAATAFHASEAPSATAIPTPALQSAADMYFVPAVAAIIAVIIIGFALLFLALRKRP
jgi:hypothetical protein